MHTSEAFGARFHVSRTLANPRLCRGRRRSFKVPATKRLLPTLKVQLPPLNRADDPSRYSPYIAHSYPLRVKPVKCDNLNWPIKRDVIAMSRWVCLPIKVNLTRLAHVPTERCRPGWLCPPQSIPRRFALLCASLSPSRSGIAGQIGPKPPTTADPVRAETRCVSSPHG